MHVLQLLDARRHAAINSEKMSKSLGNFLLLRDVLKECDARVLRMLMMQTHYRSPLDFSKERLDEAGASLGRLCCCIDRMDWLASHPDENAPAFVPETEGFTFEKAVKNVREAFAASMDDDFNTAGALGAIFGFVGEVNAALGTATFGPADVANLESVRDVIIELMGVLGIDVAPAKAEVAYPAEVVDLAREVAGFEGEDAAEAVDALLEARANARAEKNWQWPMPCATVCAAWASRSRTPLRARRFRIAARRARRLLPRSSYRVRDSGQKPLSRFYVRSEDEYNGAA